ncbi:hypothetical protein [Phycicoccus sp.]|uniref:hypothetical protein n=1 Tax=Phycicoccus sp. TaxID=1902410 RepID=UPI002C1DDA72|nr:hypothetical protein [Phycicoccus sp.]HRV56732.1 hypothetical protein [Phycicoccus sp.]
MRAGDLAAILEPDEHPVLGALDGRHPRPLVVVGYDDRTNSDVFALDTCAVIVAAGGRAALMPRNLPTPVLAYAVRALGAEAGVMVTASHNPPARPGLRARRPRREVHGPHPVDRDRVRQ